MATRDIDGDREAHRAESTDTCPDCDGRLRTVESETICGDCGLVVGDCRLERRPSRQFEDDDRQPRTGAPLTPGRHDRGLSTEIGRKRDGNGNTLSGRKQRQIGRLRRHHGRAQFESKSDRNLARACTEIASLVAALNLPRSIREQASHLFRTAQERGLARGRSIEEIAAASVYATCRCAGQTRRLTEIATRSERSYDRIEHAYMVLNRELDLPVPPRRPRDYIPAVASAVDISIEVERRATTLAKRAWEAELSIGVNPAGFAAACLEVAARERGVAVTQVALAGAADVAPVTVRTHRETLLEELAGS